MGTKTAQNSSQPTSQNNDSIEQLIKDSALEKRHSEMNIDEKILQGVHSKFTLQDCLRKSDRTKILARKIIQQYVQKN